MKDLLLYIARNLVDDPDSVSVTEVQGDQELPHRQGDPDCDPVLRPAHRR